jgi:ribonuclease P/MRP protein subunit POP5
MVRFKCRYLLAQLHYSSPLKFDAQLNSSIVKRTLIDSVENCFGNLGVGQAHISIKYFNPETKICIIRCSRDHYRLVWASLTMIKKVNNHKAFFTVLHVGGKLPNLQEKKIDISIYIYIEYLNISFL